MAISKSQARAQAAVAQLRERLPAIFTPANCRPLKIGIHNELVALGFDREMVVVGLRSYCGSSAYLSALREGAARIGPDGQLPGLVNAEDEKFAAAL
jgi:sRNA-binding protein